MMHLKPTTMKVWSHKLSWLLNLLRKTKRDSSPLSLSLSLSLSLTNAWPSVQIERDISKRHLSFRGPWARAKGAEPQISTNKSIIPTVYKHTGKISLSSCWSYLLVVSTSVGPCFDNVWVLKWICFSGTFLKWTSWCFLDLIHLFLFVTCFILLAPVML